MALQINPINWIAWPLSYKNFLRYGLTQNEFNQLAEEAGQRAESYLLECLKIPQQTLDQVTAGSRFQIAFQNLTAYEFLNVYVGAYANVSAFEELETAEDQRVKQRSEDLDRWMNFGNRLLTKAFTVLKEYQPSYKTLQPTAYPYNWSNC